MSCNGCRVLRKGCSDTCVLRSCLQWIQSPQAQGHATVFVAKFFGRAGLISFVSNVPENQRPALFQSLLFEACGRTVNPINGAVGLLWTGNWHVCQAAVDTVLRGGTLAPMPELMALDAPPSAAETTSEAEVACADIWRIPDPIPSRRFTSSRSAAKRKRSVAAPSAPNLDLHLTPTFQQNSGSRRAGSPSMASEESGTTTACKESGDRKVLKLFI
ncbi:hypothetical protein Fmac_027198 [Flemingia macrophylla]|uniref:LOB domain-containing protein n=1 Tax=Flemingia macrophylla TaxID=520843 RepID=A0ABD1LH10_9FABA